MHQILNVVLDDGSRNILPARSVINEKHLRHLRPREIEH